MRRFRRLLAVGAAVAVATAAMAGVANAAFIVGTLGDDIPLNGSRASDTIRGLAGNDYIRGLNGRDRINAGLDEDIVKAHRGADVVNVRDGDRDFVNCGAGFDIVFVDAKEYVWTDALSGYWHELDRTFRCEVVFHPSEG